MPTDLIAVIENAAREAETGVDEGGSLAEVTAGDAGGTEEASIAEAVVETPPDLEQPVVEADPLSKELEELGLKAPVAGERENRIPYSRVKKIIENSRKKLAEANAAALAERDGKLTESEKRLQNMDAVDRLIASDPDRYLGMLAALHPAYKKYLGGGAAEVKPAPVAASEPAPQPDARFEDGSIGYSAEGLQKLLEWQARQVESRVTKQIEETYTKRFGPIEQNWKSQQLINEKLPGIRQQIDTAKKTWGKAFEDDYGKDEDSEILAVMKANDGRNGRPFMTFEAAVDRVLVPRALADRNAMRADLLKEINDRPKAAAKGSPAAVSGADATGPRSTEDIIREAAATLKQ